MLARFVSLTLAVAGIIHLLPAVGVAGAARLQALYGVPIDPQLLLLMRHRAVMFGVLGALMLAAVFAAPLRGYLLAAAWVSTVSFVVLARNEPLTAALRRVIAIDIVLAVLLTAAAVAWNLRAR